MHKCYMDDILCSDDAKEKWRAKGQGPFSRLKKKKCALGDSSRVLIQMQNLSTFCVRICFITFSNSILYPLNWTLEGLRFCNILLVTMLTWKSKLYFVFKYSIILIAQKMETVLPCCQIKWNFGLFSRMTGMIWPSSTCSDIHTTSSTATLPILKK